MSDPEDRALRVIERLANLMRSEERAVALEQGLQPVQLEILDYLSRCNRYSDTPAAVTEFLALTKGTVSQSILRLEEKGLLEKHADPSDGRVVHLKLGPRGRKLAAARWDAWMQPITEGAPALAGDVELAGRLEALLRRLQASRGHRSFGACHSCALFERVRTDQFRCGLTGEALTRADSKRICREHEPQETAPR